MCSIPTDLPDSLSITLNKINYYSSVIASYDFSTFYTSIIPRDSLKQTLKYIIQEACRVRDNTFLEVCSNGKGVWSDVPSARQSLAEDKLITYVEYLIDNVYVKCRYITRSVCGHPNGH